MDQSSSADVAATPPNSVLPYRRRPLGTNALKRLGASIATGEPLTPEESELYFGFIADADTRRIITQFVVDHLVGEIADSALPRVRVASTGRTKTLKTLREKLIRTPEEKLPSIRDVAGVRLVADCSTLELQTLCGVLSSALAEEGPPIGRSAGFTGVPQVIDRIKDPMHGYRALHLVVRLDGQPVEIQLRTELQHAWAALMELLCDRWGREARYGLAVVEPDLKVWHAKQFVVDQMRSISDQIANIESQLVLVGLSHIHVDWSQVDAKGVTTARDAANEQADVNAKVEADAKASVQESLMRLRTVFDAIESAYGEDQG